MMVAKKEINRTELSSTKFNIAVLLDLNQSKQLRKYDMYLN